MSDLLTLARRINSRESTIELLRKKTEDCAGTAVAEALLQGQDLLEAKSKIKFGDWENWLKAQCPRVSTRHARRYMTLAANQPRIANLAGASSLRAALALCDINQANAKKQDPKRWPPYMEALGRLGKLVQFIKSNPISQWPDVGLEKFREDLQPLAIELWPERFGK